MKKSLRFRRNKAGEFYDQNVGLIDKKLWEQPVITEPFKNPVRKTEWERFNQLYTEVTKEST